MATLAEMKSHLNELEDQKQKLEAAILKAGQRLKDEPVGDRDRNHLASTVLVGYSNTGDRRNHGDILFFKTNEFQGQAGVPGIRNP